MKITKKKIFKVLLIVTVLFILLLGGIFLMLQYFFPSSIVKGQIESYLLDNFGIDAEIEEIDMSILNGIEIKKLSIKDDSIPDSLVSFDSFVLEYELAPLIDRQMIVKNIRVEHPKINIVRDENGRFNFDNILKKFAPKDKSGKPEKEKKTNPDTEEKEKDESSAFQIDLEELTIDRIDIQFEDRSKENPISIKLPEYSLELSDVLFVNNDDYSAVVKLKTGNENKISYMDKANTIEFLQDIDIQVNAYAGKFDVELSHNIEDLKLFSDFAYIEDIGNISVETKLEYDMNSDILSIEKFSAEVGNFLETALSGQVNGLTGDIIADVSLDKFSADVDNIVNFAESKGLAETYGTGLEESEFKLNDTKIQYNSAENTISVSGDAKFDSDKLSYQQKDISALISGFNLGSSFNVSLINNELSESSVNLNMELDNLSAKVSGKRYRTGHQRLSIVPELNSSYMPESAVISYSIDNIANGKIDIQADTQFDISDTSIPALIRNTIADISVKANGLHPHLLVSDAPERLSVSFNEQLHLKKGIIDNNLLIKTGYSKSTGFKPRVTPIDPRVLDNLSIQTELKADISGHPKHKYKLISLNSEVGDLLNADIQDLSADLNSSDFDIGTLDVSADLDKLVEIAKRAGIKEAESVQLYNGDLQISASGRTNSEDLNSKAKIDISLNIDSLYFDDIAIKEGVKINEKVQISNKDIFLSGDVSVNNADFNGMLTEMGIKGNAEVKNDIKYSEEGYVSIRKFEVDLPELKTDLKLYGYADLKDSLYNYKLDLNHSIGLMKEYSFLKGISGINGKLSGHTTLLGNKEQVEIEHTQKLDSIFFKLDIDTLGNYAKIVNLNAKIPVDLSVDITDKELIPFIKYDKIKDYDFHEYCEKRSFFKRSGLPVSNLTIDTVNLKHKVFSNDVKNIDVDLYFDDNKFCVNRFYYELFDGNTAGFLRFDAGTGNLDDLMSRADLDMGITMTGINTYYLNPSEEKGSPSTEMNIIFKLKSNGLDIINEPDLNGEMNISKISGDDAKYLLEFLNRNSGDQTAGMVKNMLNAFPGIKVDLFSFKIKNNFLYTKILLDKPWYLVYFPLPEQISLSKQSLKFYFDKYLKEE